ncbi:hypothetical protein VTL71DRAFT_10379 [Oculimacula yallundae]|uniref:Uncharacterized protein n=1 Tax=Oculimacula yallundae TaxID=86028 RepID=A0ABR4CSX4_9HELO
MSSPTIDAAHQPLTKSFSITYPLSAFLTQSPRSPPTPRIDRPPCFFLKAMKFLTQLPSKVSEATSDWVTSLSLYDFALHFSDIAASFILEFLSRLWPVAPTVVVLPCLYFGFASLQVIPVTVLCILLLSAILALVHVLFAIPTVVRYFLARPSRGWQALLCAMVGIIVRLCWVKLIKEWYPIEEPPLVFVEGDLDMEY